MEKKFSGSENHKFTTECGKIMIKRISFHNAVII
jgi:hypothetical protein